MNAITEMQGKASKLRVIRLDELENKLDSTGMSADEIQEFVKENYTVRGVTAFPKKVYER